MRLQVASPPKKIANKLRGFYEIEAPYLFGQVHNDTIVLRDSN
jgi:hypothetical protein